METVTIKSPKGATAEVHLFGAHLTSWKTTDGTEVIFVSRQAVFKPPKAIRGGVPVCWPQFGKLGPLGQHGFARNSTFAKEEATEDSVTLSFTPSEQQLKDAGWAHPFRLTIKVTVQDEALVQQMTAKNTGSEAFDFTAALHTYFNVSDVTQVQVQGLQGLKFLDNTANMKEGQETGARLSIPGEVDRIFVQTPPQLKIEDRKAGTVITIAKQGFPDAVVWNPWADKAKGMADFGDDEYKGMLCVEPALAASGPLSLHPGKPWTAQQTLHWQRLSSL